MSIKKIVFFLSCVPCILHDGPLYAGQANLGSPTSMRSGFTTQHRNIKKIVTKFSVGASAKNYDRIQQEMQFLVQLPSLDEAYAVQFVPTQGQLRNQRIEVAIVNDTQQADSQQSITLYRKLVCKTLVEWEYVDTVQVPKTSKEIIVTLKPDGTVVIGEQVILIGERYLW